MRKRSYKSLGMNFKTNGSRDNAVAHKDESKVLKPKTKSKKKTAVVISHYDDNQHISLSLPESLCAEQVFNEAHYETKNHRNTIEDAVIISESQSVSNHPSYSDANNYFIGEAEEELEADKDNNTFLASQSLEAEPQELNETSNTNIQETPQDAENQEPEIPTSIDIDRESDRKFEEDLKAILNQKKAQDKQREHQNPSEAAKNKDNGVADTSDEAFKKKLKDRHAIFDQIAQSMEMADTYDFGAIAMNKTLDNLEEETQEDFTQKIQDILKKEEKQEKDKPAYAGKKEDDNKILTEDFLEDINKLNELSSEQSKGKQDFADDAIILEEQEKAEHAKKDHEEEAVNKSPKQVLSEQSSFDSTISIKHRYLKSRVFSVSSGTVSVTIDSNWIPEGCSDISHLNVTLTQDIDWGIDKEQGTKLFKIGKADTHSWSNLPAGNYYLTFFFASNTNPHCELSGTINVVTS